MGIIYNGLNPWHHGGNRSANLGDVLATVLTTVCTNHGKNTHQDISQDKRPTAVAFAGTAPVRPCIGSRTGSKFGSADAGRGENRTTVFLRLEEKFGRFERRRQIAGLRNVTPNNSQR